MRTNSELRKAAVASLTGKWGSAAILTLLYFVICGVLPNSFGYSPSLQVVSLLLLIVLCPMQWGFVVAFLDVSRGKNVDYGTLFEGFKDFVRIFLTMLLQSIYVCLWSLLLVIPGIIKAYSYSMTNYVLRDNPELKYDAAIEKSMQMMEGNKMKLFLLDLSFIGWGILCLLTLGIGCLFLAPYQQTSHAHFYNDLKGDFGCEKAEML